MHPLKTAYECAVGKPYAAVKVERRGKELVVVPGSLCIVKPGTIVARLPDGIKVVLEDGGEIRPSRSFYITTETIDPYHLVLDM